MSFHLRITAPGQAPRFETVDAESFWLGAGVGPWLVAVPIEGLRGPLVEIRFAGGAVEARAEPGLPIEVTTVAGRLGGRFEPLLEGEGLQVAEHSIEVRRVDASEPQLAALDAAMLGSAGGEAVADWFESFMAIADRLDGVREIAESVRVALEGMLATTRAERCFIQVDVPGEPPHEWFLSRIGGSTPFGVSRSLVARVRAEQGIVFVPESSSDPVVAGLVSVRREGISSSLAVPLRALGRSCGVLYADCVEPGSSLGTNDFQKAALLGRMLAGAIGSRSLVRSVLDRQPELPEALRTRSAACKPMVEKALLFAPTDYTILVRGETGAGKEVMARALHAISNRAAAAFVAVNCAAIPEQLMESELFGHVKGSFTGAVEDREGFFVAAKGGTLFLDEIGDMQLDLQAKILRAIETKVVTPVGGTRSVAVDVRILAATHRDLEQMVRDGTFREDLYFRLRELELRIPPLRERAEDILDLAEGFIGEAAQELGVGPPPALRPDAVKLLMEHRWRGNIRELRHAMRTAVLRSGGTELGADHIDLSAGEPAAPAPSSAQPEPGTTWKQHLDDQERAALAATLEQAGGNLTKAAALFGLPRTTYRERLVRYGLL